jgi:hypothetical protein
MKTLVFFVEGHTEKELVEGLMSRLDVEPSNCDHHIFRFEGKQDLISDLRNKLRGWRTPNTQFIIMCDKDRDNCIELKTKLSEICDSARKGSCTIRIACQEIESWYLGDLEAVAKAIELPSLSVKQNKSRYRTPDNIQKPSVELANITDNKYKKRGVSHEIAKHLDFENNRSHSARLFFNTILSATTNCRGNE